MGGDDDSEGRLVAGRYRLGPVIGIGSSAVVRRGRDLRDGVRVAVKLFHPGGSLQDRRQQRREMDALSRLDHPGLVGLRDGGTESGRPFVVTDLVEGPTLAERIGRAPLPPAEVRRIGAQLADALAHVHQGGIVHRDVKPANVLLGDGSRAHLADFGIAKALDGAAATEAGTVVGTAAFLAPEQARGQHVGPPADVYALGLVLLEALTGRREYPGRAVESATARLHRRPLVPDGLPADLVGELTAMTLDDPAARPTAAAVAATLAAAPSHAAPAGGG
ncbi:serine/threonine-protein kinase, partial [Pseudonocardia hydrocarbonoxydans]|uniref:serine/threonine-protein kinase n=1 Tax=Pseudonocardia hydrocarbonoxydans TaxID=76726 RepID=UPI0031D17599